MREDGALKAGIVGDEQVARIGGSLCGTLSPGNHSSTGSASMAKPTHHTAVEGSVA
jgi:hypothetical protein